MRAIAEYQQIGGARRNPVPVYGFHTAGLDAKTVIRRDVRFAVR